MVCLCFTCYHTLGSSQVWGAAEASELAHPNNDFEDNSSFAQPDQHLLRASPITSIHTRKSIILTDSSTVEEPDPSERFNPKTAIPPAAR